MEQRAPAYNFFLPQLSEILLHSDVQWVFESNISEGVGGVNSSLQCFLFYCKGFYY